MQQLQYQKINEMSMAEAALEYVRAGYKIIPQQTHAPKPIISRAEAEAKGVKGSVDEPLETEEEVKEFWEKYPQANIRIVSEYIALMDIDQHTNGADGFENLPDDRPKTLTSNSKSGGGGHLWFKNPEGRKFKAVNAWPGVDLISGQYGLVVPPSYFGEGKPYKWLNDLPMAEFNYDWLQEKNNTDTGNVNNKYIPYCDPSMEGNRNNDLCQIIGHTISQGKGYNTVYQVASVHNQMFCCPPLPEDELKAKVDGIWSKHNDTDIIAQFNQNYAQVLLSGKHVIIRKSDNELIQKSDFLSWHEHDTIEVNDKEISKAKYWLNHKNAERYEKLTFNPTGNTEPGTYNMWKGFAVQPNKFGSCELIKDHIHKNVCQGNDDKYTAIMDWLASIVQQKPEGGPNTALVIVGKKGTGKNVFCEVLRHIVGDNQYCEVQTTEHLLGKFSANSIKNKLVTVADEAFWAGTKSHEGLLKARITNKYLTLEEKFMPQYKIENFNNLIILSNEKWVVPVTADERRFLIVEIGNDKRNNHQYFGNLIKEVNKGGAGAFLFELQNREIQNTQWLRNAPKFDEAFQQLEYSMDLTTRFWWNLISDSLDFDLDNFGANVDKSLIEETYRSFIEAHSNSKPLDNRRFWKETYDIFPELKKDVKVTEGIGRVRKKHLPKQIEMVEQFEKATGFDLSQHKIKQEKTGKALEFSKPPEKRKFEDLV